MTSVRYFAVRSETDPKTTYTLALLSGQDAGPKAVACTCPRFAKGGFVCKHMAALETDAHVGTIGPRFTEFQLKGGVLTNPQAKP